MRTLVQFWGVLLVAGVLLAACAPATPATTPAAARRTLTIMTHDSFAASEEPGHSQQG